MHSALDVGSSDTGESIPPYNSRLLILFATAKVGDVQKNRAGSFWIRRYFCVRAYVSIRSAPTTESESTIRVSRGYTSQQV